MAFQWGKEEQFEINIWLNVAKWSGEIALPLSVSWWNAEVAGGTKNTSVSIYFLCFGFNLEIWKWGKNDA